MLNLSRRQAHGTERRRYNLGDKKYVPKKLKDAESSYVQSKTPDQMGRMPFGRYEFERFERVPKAYLLRYKGDPSIDKYPNLVNFIDGIEYE